jgi:hypothetical protein
LPIENRGPQDVHIERFLSTCSCLATTPASLLVPAGQTRDVELTLDLTGKPSSQDPPPTAPFRAEIRPALRGASGLTTLSGWEVHGTVRKVLRFSPFQVDFGKHSERSQPLPAQCVKVTSLVPLRQVTAACRTDHFRAELKQRGENSLNYELVISPKGLIPPARYHFVIEVTAELNSGQKVRARELWGQGEVAADVQASPPQVSLGAAKQSATVVESVTLSSLTGTSFKVVGHRAEGAGLTIEQYPDQA